MFVFELTYRQLYSDRENILGEETSINQTGDNRNTIIQSSWEGRFSMNVSYIKINFNSNQNSSLSF